MDTKNYKRTINIDGKEFGFHIYPSFGKIHAEIYYLHPLHQAEVFVIDKYFKRMFKELDEQDYINAKIWCENHMKHIKEANTYEG